MTIKGGNGRSEDLYDYCIRGVNYTLHHSIQDCLTSCPSIFVSREATKNGHGHGAYNLVAGHLQGYDTDVEEQ